MIHQIAFWLWYALAAHNSSPNFAVATLTPSPAAPYVEGDSILYRALRDQLAARVATLAPEKCYLHTDRTLFQPGETLWFNAYLRNAGDLRPALASQVLYVTLLDPRGSVLGEKTLLVLEGVAAGEFDLGTHLPGGLYKLKAQTQWMKNTGEAFERDITLQKTVLPRLNLKLEFERKAFGPGDVVTARFDAHSLDNLPLAKREVSFVASVEGREVLQGKAETDATGRAQLHFTLPHQIEQPDGLLNLQIENNGQTEAISRAIPLVLNKIDLQFFPEGGDAVVGLPCRMAFKALNEFGKPADVEGRIEDETGRDIQRFSSFHDGMGAFEFTPEPGKRYVARLEKPVASQQTYPLPAALSEGPTLRLTAQNEQYLFFDIHAQRPTTVVLAGSVRDKLCYFKSFSIAKGSESAAVPIAGLPMGIARFTLFEADQSLLEARATGIQANLSKNLVERAERLVFLHRDKGLRLEITTDKNQYQPKEKINLRLRALDHLGRPVQGHFSLAVADENQLSFADDKQGHLLSALLLEQDLKGSVEEPNFYFDPKEAKSLPALDYLMLTQGWRRFVWQEVLENKPLNYTFQGEKTEIAGTLLVVENNKLKPAKGHTLQLFPNGPIQTTDETGRFAFASVDLSQYFALLDAKNVYHDLHDYRSDYTVYEGQWQNLTHSPRYTPQGGQTVLTGIVKDQTEELIGATVKVMQGNVFVRGTITNVEGRFWISVPPGKYDLEVSYTGYTASKVTGIPAPENTLVHHDFLLKSNASLSEVAITQYKVPLIRQDAISSGQTVVLGGGNGAGPGRVKKNKKMAPSKETDTAQALTAEQIKKLPTRDVKKIVAQADEQLVMEDVAVNIKGARANGTNFYLDGIRVNPASIPPVQDMDDLEEAPPALMEEKEFKVIEKAPVKIWDGLKKRDKQAPGRSAAKPVPNNGRAFHRARAFYAPKYDDPTPDQTGKDYRSTLYWNPSIQTDVYGYADLSFFASDAITNFRVTAEGIGLDGQPGRSEYKFFTQKALDINLKTPAFVITGDTLCLQVSLHNNSAYPVKGHFEAMVPAHFNLLGNGTAEEAQVPPNGNTLLECRYRIGTTSNHEDLPIRVRFAAPEAFDELYETKVRTLDRGFPVRQVFAGNHAQEMFNILMDEPVEGTASAILTAYPSALEDVLKGMERMLRQPSGCFEQVSSSNYPNLLVLNLLRENGQARPEVEKRAMDLLEDGYKRLIAYECKNGGFDWFGREPAHEGLTAYGLLEFVDMSRVYPVDAALIERTAQWLHARRDGKGGWTLNPNALHGWQCGPALNAYIAWACAEAGFGQRFKPEIEHMVATAKKSKDAYQLALATSCLLAVKDDRAKELLPQLLALQGEDGAWKSDGYSAMGGRGECLRIETTALAALAMMKAGTTGPAIQKALDCIIKAKNEYGYGSTQSTVLALKALCEFTKQNNNQPANGTLIVQVNGKRVAEQAFSTKSPQRIEVKALERFLTQRDNRVEVFFAQGSAVVPFDVEVKYAARRPRNTPACPLSLQTSLAKTQAKMGETVRLQAVVQNKGTETLPSPMVILGIPAGLTLQPWQLKKLTEEKRCDFYELWDGYAVFYFDRLLPAERRTLDLDLRADISGAFEAPASQAFLYYQNDQRVWSKPERVVVR